MELSHTMVVRIDTSFPNFCAENFTGPQNSYNGYFRGGVCDKATAQMAQFRAIRIASEPSQQCDLVNENENENGEKRQNNEFVNEN